MSWTGLQILAPFAARLSPRPPHLGPSAESSEPSVVELLGVHRLGEGSLYHLKNSSAVCRPLSTYSEPRELSLRSARANFVEGFVHLSKSLQSSSL